ncbi:MAG TPA: hypothetical protein VG652_04325 [Gaiellaceae bacterium]|nr:hypothetical protein [Gaiellaceae bacterium]
MTNVRSRRPAIRQVGMAALVAVAGVLCALVVAGCGSTSKASPPTTSSTASSTTTATSASQTAFRTCLTQHGATLPAGGGFGGGGGGGFGGGGQPGATGGNRPAPSAALQKALTACASLRPAGGFGGRGGARPGGAGTNSNNPAFAKFQSCLKAHGVTGTNSKNSASAIAACRSDLPNGGNGTGAQSGTTTPAG